MTVLEAIQANPVLANVSEQYIETVLIGRSFNGATIYSESSLKDVELVTADLYAAIATTPEFKEGQLAIKYDPAVLIKRALALYKKHDDEKAALIGPQPIDVNVTVVDA